MEPLESPRVEQVGGILSRGEDTDGERTDDELDYPSESFVSQVQDEPDDDGQQDAAEELEVTGEGTAGGPFGLKKVLFVRKKSDKNITSKEDPNKSQEGTLKDRFSKLGAGVGERFAALGSIMQDHGKTASGAAKTDKPAIDTNGQVGETDGGTPVKPQASAPNSNPRPTTPKRALEYFEEYEMTFTSKPDFCVVQGPGGKGAMVSWEGDGVANAAAASSGSGTGAVASGDVVATASTDAVRVPASGAIVLAVAGESVQEAELAGVVARMMGEGLDGDDSEGQGTQAEVGKGGQEPEQSSVEPADGTEQKGAFPVVVRFREKTRPPHDGTHGPGAGGELFRNRMKAMATGFGNLFQVKETGGSVVRDGSDHSGVSAAGAGATTATVSDVFVLTFAANSGTAEDLPFTMVEMIGGRGVVVSGVREEYASTLVAPEEAGVSTAGMAAVVAEGMGKEGARGTLDVLAPGAVLLRVAGQSVEGKSLDRVRKMIGSTAAEHSAVKILFRRAAPIYRASIAAELTLERAKVPHVHVGTWQPLLKRRAGVTLGGGDGDNAGGGSGGGVIGLGYGGEEWEDVRETMARAQRFVDGFRSVGVRVDVVSMQTVTLPRDAKSAYASAFEGRFSSFQQAVRLWFSFPDERTILLQKQSTSEKLGLSHVETKGSGALGAWVVVTAADASPCAEAGVPVGENSILTHVNGFDVSPAAYRSLAPLPYGQGEGWAAAVLPALESGGSETVTLTFV